MTYPPLINYISIVSFNGGEMKASAMEEFHRAEIGILGGTGLYEIEGIEDIEHVEFQTPFGPPSDVFILGLLELFCTHLCLDEDLLTFISFDGDRASVNKDFNKAGF